MKWIRKEHEFDEYAQVITEEFRKRDRKIYIYLEQDSLGWKSELYSKNINVLPHLLIMIIINNRQG